MQEIGCAMIQQHWHLLRKILDGDLPYSHAAEAVEVAFHAHAAETVNVAIHRDMFLK